MLQLPPVARRVPASAGQLLGVIPLTMNSTLHPACARLAGTGSAPTGVSPGVSPRAGRLTPRRRQFASLSTWARSTVRVLPPSVVRSSPASCGRYITIDVPNLGRDFGDTAIEQRRPRPTSRKPGLARPGSRDLGLAAYGSPSPCVQFLPRPRLNPWLVATLQPAPRPRTRVAARRPGFDSSPVLRGVTASFGACPLACRHGVYRRFGWWSQAPRGLL